jgi:hypothetical protein
MHQLLAVPHPRYWREWELALLRVHYPHVPTEPIAAALGRPLKTVHSKAIALGLKKTRELIATIASERTRRPGHGGQAHQFKPGLVPWNKGTKGLVGTQPACRATQFKPGSRPHTWVPVGSFRVSADGVLELKVHDEPGDHNKVKRWRNFSQVVWERDVGPIPAGHIVVFKPGQRTTEPQLVTADRLECISRAENVRRNSVHQLPPELRELVHLRGRLSRAINTKARQGQEHHAP